MYPRRVDAPVALGYLTIPRKGSGSRGGPTWLSERRQTQAKLERLQESVERLLCRVVARVDRAQHIRAGHAHLGREFLDAHRSDHFPERKLQVHAFVDRCQQELAGECCVTKVLRQPDVPIFTSSC